jgi:hypothetical protein
VPPEASRELATLAARGMQLQITVQEGSDLGGQRPALGGAGAGGAAAPDDPLTIPRTRAGNAPIIGIPA